jgi:hypothetical protein
MLLLLLALAIMSTHGAADENFTYYPFTDSITEDDVVFYEFDINTTDVSIYIEVVWFDEDDDLDLYMVDPEGTIVTVGIDTEPYIEYIIFFPNLTGTYTFAVSGWSVWDSIKYHGNCSSPVRKLTMPFGGSISEGDVVQRRVDVNTIRSPLFIRVSWDFETDRLNLTVDDPSGYAIWELGEYWYQGNAVFFLYFPAIVGNYTITIKGLNISSADSLTYTATSNFPVSEEIGNGNVPTGDDTEWSVPIMVASLLVVLGLSAYAVSRARPRPAASGHGYTVEEVFVVHTDGRLVYSAARGGEDATPDADLMSGMLIAIQGFIKEGLRSGGSLESIKYGDSVIVLASSAVVVLAARVTGSPGEDLSKALRTAVDRIEAEESADLEQWTGEMGVVPSLEVVVRQLLDLSSQG